MKSNYVAPEELEPFFRSKKDLYKLLVYECKSNEHKQHHSKLFSSKLQELSASLPSTNTQRREEGKYMIYSHIVKALKQNKVSALVVPKYKKLSVSCIWNFVKVIDDLWEYFHDLEDGQYLKEIFL